MTKILNFRLSNFDKLDLKQSKDPNGSTNTKKPKFPELISSTYKVYSV